MEKLTYDTVQPGEELGPIEYKVTAEKLAAYRSAVADPGAVLLTIGSKDYSHLLATKFERSSRINAKHEAWYSGAAEVGSMLTTRGRIVDKYVKRDREFIVVETWTEDESGRELVRSRTALSIGKRTGAEGSR